MSDLPTQIAQMQSSLDNLKAQALAPTVNPLAGNQVEPGYTTTEFWSTVAIVLAGVIDIFHPGFKAPPSDVQAFGFAASGLATVGYSFARSWRKKG